MFIYGGYRDVLGTEGQDGPGVWYYDVAEQLGAWIAETAAAGVRVDESDIVAKAVELTNEWLSEVNQ